VEPRMYVHKYMDVPPGGRPGFCLSCISLSGSLCYRIIVSTLFVGTFLFAPEAITGFVHLESQ
jgi:hypothetical protein